MLGQVPSNPLKRKFIQVDTDQEFSYQNSVIRDITSILKTMYGGPLSTWKKVGKDDRDAMWQHFKGLYEWLESDPVVCDIWDHCMNR